MLRIVAALVICAGCAAACSETPQQPPAQTPPAVAPVETADNSPSKPNLFLPQELGLIEAPDRAEWWKPELIMDELAIAEGDKVADLGAGGGWFTIQLA